MNEEAIPVNRLVRIFIKMRDKRDAMRKQFEMEEAELEEQMTAVRSELLAACDSIKATSLRTEYGTVTRTTKTRYWSNDWASMHEFCKEHDTLDLLERRIHQTNMKTYLQEHPDLLPPGLNSDSYYDVTVRRK